MTYLIRILQLSVFCLAIAIILSFTAPFGWPFDLFGQFQVQFALAGLIFSAVLGLFRKFLIALLCVVLSGVSIWQINVFSGDRFAQKAASTEETFNVAVANLFGSQKALERLIELHRDSAFDFLILTELPLPADEAMLARFKNIKYVAGLPDQALFGKPSAIILSSVEPREIKFVPANFNPYALTEAGFCLEGHERCLTVVALHPPPPLGPRYYQRQKKILEKLAERLKDQTGPVLVAGDFNAVSWSPLMHKLRQDTGLMKVACGSRLSPTWLAPIPGIGLELDHVFIKGPIVPNECELGPFLGSDHWPLFAKFNSNSLAK